MEVSLSIGCYCSFVGGSNILCPKEELIGLIGDAEGRPAPREEGDINHLVCKAYIAILKYLVPDFDLYYIHY